MLPAQLVSSRLDSSRLVSSCLVVGFTLRGSAGARGCGCGCGWGWDWVGTGTEAGAGAGQVCWNGQTKSKLKSKWVNTFCSKPVEHTPHYASDTYNTIHHQHHHRLELELGLGLTVVFLSQVSRTRNISIERLDWSICCCIFYVYFILFILWFALSIVWHRFPPFPPVHLPLCCPSVSLFICSGSTASQCGFAKPNELLLQLHDPWNDMTIACTMSSDIPDSGSGSGYVCS